MTDTLRIEAAGADAVGQQAAHLGLLVTGTLTSGGRHATAGGFVSSSFRKFGMTHVRPAP